MAAMLTRLAAQAARCAPSAALGVTRGASALSTTSQAKKPRGEGREKPQAKAAEGEGEALYDPYKLYEERTGSRGYREFNPDLYEGGEFVWEEPEAMMQDKSWPATSNELFADLLNVSGQTLPEDKQRLALQEAFRRAGYSGIQGVKLPEIGVQIAQDHPDREALEIMKLSLLNNGRIGMDDKEEILKSIVDEIDHVRKDKTVLFKGLN